jgi:formate-dependent nitrite reductase membrane component NrfD
MILRTHVADGRNIDPHEGVLRGEGSEQQVARPARAWPVPTDAPAAARTATAPATYYGLPIVKPPPWRWFVPAYFHVGGVAGASSVLAAAAELGGRRLAPLARKAHAIALAGEVLSAGLLIADLGKPERFLNMLRVFRPTSPMNVGSWILGAAGSSSAASVALGLLAPRRGLRVPGVAGALSGAMLTTYTAVLITNTAIPIWKAPRRAMPVLFAATSAAAAAALLDLLGPSTRAEARAVRVFGGIARAAELAAAAGLARAISDPVVAAPLRRGRAGALWKGAAILGAAALAATFVPGRPARIARGLLGTAASIALRYAIVDAGRASARDPQATLAQQGASR